VEGNRFNGGHDTSPSSAVLNVHHKIRYLANIHVHIIIAVSDYKKNTSIHVHSTITLRKTTPTNSPHPWTVLAPKHDKYLFQHYLAILQIYLFNQMRNRIRCRAPNTSRLHLVCSSYARSCLGRHIYSVFSLQKYTSLHPFNQHPPQNITDKLDLGLWTDSPQKRRQNDKTPPNNSQTYSLRRITIIGFACTM
jgi:hypothetical protein